MWFERNSRFCGLNHVVLSRFRRTYVGSLSVHFLKEKQSKFQEKSYFIAISQVRVRARYRLYGRLRTPGFRRLFSNLSRNVEGHFARRNERRISREIWDYFPTHIFLQNLASIQPRASPCEIDSRFQDCKIDRLLYITIYFMNSGWLQEWLQ